jgi:uncharacterized membrane protein
MHTWERHELKQRAKNVLKVNYWIAFVVALILVIVGGGFSLSGSSWRTNKSFSVQGLYKYDSIGEFFAEFPEDMRDGIYFDSDLDGQEVRENVIRYSPFIFGAIIIGLIVFLIAFLIAVAFSIFVANPLQLGCISFFKTSAEIPHKNMNDLGKGFRNGNYKNVVKTMFLRDLFIFLWSLLLIIPGIIKSYSYKMVPYILADNPKMDSSEAIALSRKMMNGQKWRTFVLDLSFIGWYILGLIALGVGVLFVHPYKFSTDAQLYLVLRNKAIDEGDVSSEKLLLIEAEA